MKLPVNIYFIYGILIFMILAFIIFSNKTNENFDDNEKDQFEKDVTYIRSKIDELNNKNDRILIVLNNMNTPNGNNKFNKHR